MEERNCYVYEDYRMDNWTCCYVGMGSKNEENGYNRFEVAERNDHHDNIMNSCGIARVIIRDNLTRSEANALEEARIYYYVFVLGYTIDIKGYNKSRKNDSHLTNQTWGGDGIKGCNPYANKSEEEMKEIAKKKSEASKGRNPYANKTEEELEEWKRKLSEAKKGVNPYANKTEEEKGEWKRKIGEASKGRNPYANKTEEEIKEWKKKQSEAKKGVNPYANKTEKELEEWKKKKSESMKGKYTGEKNPSARKVRCLETGEIFTTVKEASEWCGLKSKSDIAGQIKGRRKSAGKHPVTGEKLHWEYVD